jgi:hypothetical protein
MASPDDFLKRNGSGFIDYERSFVKIAPALEIPNTLVLVFNYPTVMNIAFLRASLYIEGGQAYKKAFVVNGRSIIKNADLMKAMDKLGVAGHDFRASSLLDFWNSMDQMDPRAFRPVPSSSYNELLPIEFELRRALEPYFLKHPETTIVAVSANYYSSTVFSHEISHAQYFNIPEYRSAVIAYWNSLSELDRGQIRDYLSGPGKFYDRNQEDLLINEFQAYLTHLDFYKNPKIAANLGRYRPLLRKHLLQSLPESKFIEIQRPESEKIIGPCEAYLLVDK